MTHLTPVTLLIAIPLIAAACAAFCRTQKAFALVVRSASALIIAFSVFFVWNNYAGVFSADLTGVVWIKPVTLVIEVLMALYIISIGVRRRSWLVSVLAAAQIGLAIWLELSGEVHVERTLYIDKLSLVMIGIVGIIGGLICIYSVEYMKDYHRHHPEFKDRRNMFFAVLFVFIAAMYGIVVSNDMTLMLFFWEITTLCSFLLIGYSKTKEAVKNATFALTVNVFGGLCFLTGIAIVGVRAGAADFIGLMSLDSSAPAVMAAVFLIALAGLTKAAQLPFSKWLLGAMAAPTPTSAMLHSSTMVKAGVYLIIRLAPMLGRNAAGISITLVGGVTFFITAVLAVSQTDAKKILAYSTISNLGLIIACAGLATAESLWAAVMLIIFHAIAKSLLFLSVGSTEHLLGSRDVEDMDGLLNISTPLAMLLIIGIAGMFVAPFGMLISKWAAMKAFVDSGNIPIVLIIAFGSTVTLFFWTKWIGKLIANSWRPAPTNYIMRGDEKASLYSLAAMVFVVCALHPVISNVFILPYIDESMKVAFTSPIAPLSTTIIILLMLLLFVIPLILIPIYRKHGVKPTSMYLSGGNVAEDETFRGAMGRTHKVELKNWYMKGIIKDVSLLRVGYMISLCILVLGFFVAMGGVFL